MEDSSLGRGSVAVEDMKRRLEEMKNQNLSADEIINRLWERSQRAETGDGYMYDKLLSR